MFLKRWQILAVRQGSARAKLSGRRACSLQPEGRQRAKLRAWRGRWQAVGGRCPFQAASGPGGSPCGAPCPKCPSSPESQIPSRPVPTGSACALGHREQGCRHPEGASRSASRHGVAPLVAVCLGRMPSPLRLHLPFETAVQSLLTPSDPLLVPSSRVRPVAHEEPMDESTSRSNLRVRRHAPFEDGYRALLVERHAVRRAETDPEPLFDAHRKRSCWITCCCVNAGLLKKCFPEHAAGPARRARSCVDVPNSVDVLANALFHRHVALPAFERKTMLFVTGNPGVEKTTAIHSGGLMAGDCGVVHEGQLSHFDQAQERIGLCLWRGGEAPVDALHHVPETALLHASCASAPLAELPASWPCPPSKESSSPRRTGGSANALAGRPRSAPLLCGYESWFQPAAWQPSRFWRAGEGHRTSASGVKQSLSACAERDASANRPGGKPEACGLLHSSKFQLFLQGLREGGLRLKNSSEAQSENARSLWQHELQLCSQPCGRRTLNVWPARSGRAFSGKPSASPGLGSCRGGAGLRAGRRFPLFSSLPDGLRPGVAASAPSVPAALFPKTPWL